MLYYFDLMGKLTYIPQRIKITLVTYSFFYQFLLLKSSDVFPAANNTGKGLQGPASL